MDSAFEKPLQPELEKPKEEERAFATEFENRYTSNAQSQIKSDAVRQFLTVGEGDVIIENIERKLRTSISTIPENVTANSPLHVQDCIFSFSKPFVCVRYNLGEYGGRSLPLQCPQLELTSKFTDPNDVDNKEYIDEQLLLPYSSEILKKDTALRQVDRRELFDLLDIKKFPEPSDSRPLGTNSISFVDYTLNITIKNANFSSLESIEPFFISLTLYNVNTRNPISESFFCTFSDLSLFKKLQRRPSPPGKSTQAKTASFRISDCSKDIILIVRLEKLLLGDVETGTSVYFKNLKSKEKTKYTNSIDNASKRIGAYSQSFGVGIVPLFKDDNSPIFGRVKRTQMLDKIIRLSGDITDENILKNLKSILAEKYNKFKVYPGSVHFEFQSNPDIEGKITPTLVPIIPESPDVVREIQEFHTEENGLAPYSEWVNTLYLYPISLNLSSWSGKGSARNLCIEISIRENDSAGETSRNLPLIYGKTCEPDFVDSARTTVTYHAPKTTFHDEIKICLPAKITPKHHIFFKISHINVTPKSKKEKPEDIVSTVSYACLPLMSLEGDLIQDQEHFLSTVYNYPPSYLSPETEDSVKFVEKNRKPNLIVRTKLVSTVNTLNNSLATFFKEYDQNIDSSSLRTAINGLRIVSPAIATKWCNVIITSLLRIMSTHDSISTIDEAFQSIMFIANNISKIEGVNLAERSNILVSFVNHFFEPPPGKIILSDVLIASFVRTLALKNAEINDVTGRYNWFAFDLIIKSMQLHLHKNNSLNESVPRKQRFGPQTGTDIAKLVALTLDEVTTNAALARVMNENIALFLKDLFSIYDRGLVMDLVYLYCSKLPKTATPLRFSFLRIICDYEHYIQLNLPLPDRIVDIPSLQMLLWNNHFLSTVLVNAVIDQLKSLEWISALTAVDTLFFLLVKHSRDPRYQNILAQTCIPGIYFSFILKLAQANDENYRCISDAPYALRIKLLSCFLWITKNIQKKLLQQWWSLDTQKMITSYFVILAHCVNTFEYQSTGESSDLLTSVKLASNQVVLENNPAANPNLSASQKVDKKSSNCPIIKNTYDDLKEQNLSYEVNLIIIDLLMLFINDNVAELRKQDSPYMDRIVINLLTLMLRKKQGHMVLFSLFNAVRHTIVMFPGAFFIEQTPYCGEITYAILRHCNSALSEVRAKSCALFYLLLRNNFLAAKNFSRMKLQATIAVSKLVGEGSDMVPDRFKSSLQAVSAFAQKDSSVPHHFQKEVLDLTDRLFTVLRNSIKITEFSFDPEMTADLYYEISKGYLASPDMRAAWLQNLANFHEKHQNHEEAAQCQIHLAALISVYINKLKPNESVPVNPLQFRRSAPNSYNEMRVPKEAFEEEGICQSSLFSRIGMSDQLKKAVIHLKQDSLFESCIAVQRLLIEVMKENRNYEHMGGIFEDLQTLSKDILTSNESNSRLFSNYYLVCFYGEAFQDLNGSQYIYKERQMTRLADLSSRLVEQFKGKFGECKTISASADTSSLDPKTPFIMTLTIKPYFTPEELATEARSAFEKQFNINKFIYESPLTTTGAKYSEEITEQAKKKTILEIDTPFPFVIKRARVIKQSSQILSPIQTSTELIEERCSATAQEIDAIPPNPKTLQIILQGSVLLQVNAGPLAIAKTFLGNKKAYPTDDIAKLEDAMERFVTLCGDAVKLNKLLIGPDQMEFQSHLEKGYESLYKEYSELKGK